MSRVSVRAAGAVMVACLGMSVAAVAALQNQTAVPIDRDDIGGVVTSAKGPEAGVWVIAETRELPTKFVRIVVTDDRGRYLLPDLPSATYTVWVRGYGLVDSQKVQSAPGRQLNLAAVIAPDARAAAQYYPANYWLSLMRLPAPGEFPGTGDGGNGLGPMMRNQDDFVGNLTSNGCNTCHQLGNKITREAPRAGGFESSVAAWDHRVKAGQSGSYMSGRLSLLGRRRALEVLADWTDRIAADAVPDAPPRPQGVERNIVITQWDMGNEREFLHDVISSDERKPTVNANGPVYGVTEFSGDRLLILDPNKHSWTGLTVPILDEKNPPPLQWFRQNGVPSPVWGDEIIWNARSAPHNPMVDDKGRVWMTSGVRPAPNPDWCKAGSSHPSARKFPITAAGKHLAVYDPRTKAMTPIDLCFSTHHLDFAYDRDNTIWFDTNNIAGWFNTRIWDETHDTQKAQGWVPWILDTNGNGKQDAWVEPGQPIDPAKDTRILGSTYDVSGSPHDGSIWFAEASTPGRLFRVAPGPNPPDTALTEVYEPKPGAHTFRGGPEVDRNGIVWVAAGSGHMASLDRGKCKVLNGPTATGKHCPEGWTYYKEPGPRFMGTDQGTDGHYLTHVDPFNTSGLGDNVPFAIGTNSDSLIGMLPGGRFVFFRVPYPMGFSAKGMDGRIDDPNAGWKGRGLWSVYAGQAMWHKEEGNRKGETPTAVKFQVRPDPLAK